MEIKFTLTPEYGNHLLIASHKINDELYIQSREMVDDYMLSTPSIIDPIKEKMKSAVKREVIASKPPLTWC